MYTALILTHILCMVSSMVLVPTAILLALRGIRTSMKIATIGFVTAGTGFMTGVIMLVSNPLLTECVILTSYLAAVISVYAFGFGWGVESRARLLKSHS